VPSDSQAAPPAAIAKARVEFLALVEDLRPELHRYCARLTGSVIEGEDIVQETLARAFYTLSLSPEMPPLRPWLFKIGHNAAVDFLKSHGRKTTEPRADLADLAGSTGVAGFEDAADPFVVRAALARFLDLPLTQRSAVILKDVLDHSLEETAETMGTTVMAVKAALVRGRGKLRASEHGERGEKSDRADATTRGGSGGGPDRLAELNRYASLFNARDWDGVRALIANDCRLDLVSRSQRRGKEVGLYFSNYALESVELRPVLLEGEPALAAHVAGEPRASYFILLDFVDGRVESIRDFRYAPYVAAEAEFATL
jgi:RNA polymerase sigma factor (sigma-70 family)